jgi:hypothetical protein
MSSLVIDISSIGCSPVVVFHFAILAPLAWCGHQTFDPHSLQKLGFPISLLSQTGRLRVKPTVLLPFVLGLTKSTSRARITAIAVPVRNSLRIQPAFSAMLLSLIHFATTKMLAVRKIIPINPKTMIFLMSRLIIYPFQKVNVYHHRAWRVTLWSASPFSQEDRIK